MQICFRNLSASAHSKESGKTVILHPMSGRLDSGTFTALIGPSGSGKTTLLNILSGRLVSDTVESYGCVSINGINTVDINSFGNRIGYVIQDDALLATLTPRQIFQFVVRIRRNDLSDQQQQLLIDQTIKKLQLESCKNTLIGNQIIRGISGGQRKRTAIGCEYLLDPLVLFLDEPTTGLDSTTALHIMRFVKQMTINGRTVVATIHQPSSQLFNQFSRIMMICEGKLIFHGDKDQARQHFKSIGYIVPSFTNPCDFYMKLLNKEGLAPLDKINQLDQCILQQDFQARLKLLYESFENQQKKQDYEPLLSDAVESGTFIQKRWFNSFSLLVKRQFLSQMRNPMDLKVKVLTNLFQGAVCALLFYKKQGNSLEQMRNISGALFFLTMTLILKGTIGSVGTFNIQRLLFVRQRISNLYSTFTFYLALSLVFIPFQILLITMLVLITYWACNFNNDPAYFFTHLLICLISNMAATSFGLLCGSLISNYELLVSLISVLIMPFLLVAGYYNNAVPNFLIWLEYLSIPKFTFSALIQNQFSEQTICTNLTTKLDYKCNVMQEFYPNIKQGLWLSLGILLIFIVILRIVSYFILDWLSNPKRNLINSPIRNGDEQRGLTNRFLQNNQ